jgi:hypothetical protein
LPATDTASSNALNLSLCGAKQYSIVEAIPASFITITAPAGDQYVDSWTLSCLSNNLADVGVYTVTLKVVLQDYSGVTAATKTVQVTVLHICATTNIDSQSFTPSDYQISKSVTTAQTIFSFTMNTDTIGT